MKNPRPLSKALFGAMLCSTLCVTGFALPPVESPVGTFIFQTPEVPPEPPYPITEMAFLAGSYVDSGSYFGVTIDLSMDPDGKVIAMGVLPGFRTKKDVKAGMTSDSQNVRTLYVRTINGEPVLTANATAAGEYDEDGVPTTEDSTATASGQADIFLGSFPPVDDPGAVPVRSSFSGKLEADKGKEKPSMSFLFLDPAQVQALAVKEWSAILVVSQRIDSRSRPFHVASAILTKPDGTEIRFPERRVIYSERSGYTIPFSNGTKYSLGQPVVDARDNPVKDKTAKLKFTNLLFKKEFDIDDEPYFTPAGGGVEYQFFGQKGFGHTFNFEVFGGTSAILPE